MFQPLPSRSFIDGVEAGANAVVQVGFKDHQPRMEHTETVRASAASDQRTTRTDMTTGRENIPAPIVPPMIATLPSSEGDDV